MIVNKETFDRLKASVAAAAGEGGEVIVPADAADRLFTTDPRWLLLRQAIRQQIQSQKIIRDNHRRLKARASK